ncbi:MAG TPA: homoserine O-acetyltransferase [Gemmatimonadaceae bacterium]|nr:homoserine O-acetyltransferase [Gemmatimonadaceae bacterium]
MIAATQVARAGTWSPRVAPEVLGTRETATVEARHRCIHLLDRFELESGEVLRDVRQAYYLDGTLNAARDNLVVVCHALTGSADAAGDWWSDIVGPGRAIDTRRYAVLCANLLGSCYGTTGPSDPARRPFPRVTTRDMARLTERLVASLHVSSIALVVGGSLGGMVAMGLAASVPQLVRRAVILAAPAAHPAAAIGWNHVQRRIVSLAGEEGLEIARMVAMLTYRTPAELERRFARAAHADGGLAVERYLDHQGRKLRARFDVHSYLALLDAMDAHDVGRDRGGIEAALAPIADRITGVGIPGDVLYAATDVRGWTDAVGARYREIHSIHGHDAFLLEHEQVAVLLQEALGPASTRGPV